MARGGYVDDRHDMENGTSSEKRGWGVVFDCPFPVLVGRICSKCCCV